MGEMHVVVPKEPVQPPVAVSQTEKLQRQIGELKRQLMDAKDKLEAKGYVEDGSSAEQLAAENEKLYLKIDQLKQQMETIQEGADKRDADRQNVISQQNDMIQELSDKLTRLNQSLADKNRTIERQKETNHKMAEQLEEARKQTDEFKADLDKMLAENEELKKTSIQIKAPQIPVDSWEAIRQALKTLQDNLGKASEEFSKLVDFKAIIGAQLSDLSESVRNLNDDDILAESASGKPTPRQIRRQHGDKAKDVAMKIGTMPNNYWALENLKKNWVPEKRQKFCELYELQESDVEWGDSH